MQHNQRHLFPPTHTCIPLPCQNTHVNHRIDQHSHSTQFSSCLKQFASLVNVGNLTDLSIIILPVPDRLSDQ